MGCLGHGFQSRPDVISTTATNIPAALGCEQGELLLVPAAVRPVLPPEGLLVLLLEFGFKR